jgi:lysophospholipase L1-like esterase
MISIAPLLQHGFDPKNSGWVASLSNYWTRKVDVINRGFSGYNSKMGMYIKKWRLYEHSIIKCNVVYILYIPYVMLYIYILIYIFTYAYSCI